MSDYMDAIKMFTESELAHILTIQRELYELWGRWPTPAEVLARLHGTD